MTRSYWVYMLASRSRNLYKGVTNSLQRRLIEHREGTIPGFTSRYRIFRLVHYEVYTDTRFAIAREKEIKGWRREKKIWLIERKNPRWDDLAAGFHGKEQKHGSPTYSVGEYERREKKRQKQQGETKADPSPPSKIRPGSG